MFNANQLNLRKNAVKKGQFQHANERDESESSRDEREEDSDGPGKLKDKSDIEEQI